MPTLVTSSSLPFKFAPRLAPPDLVNAHNATEERVGVRRFEPVDVALRQVGSLRVVVRDLVLTWCQHPDERVPLALLARPGHDLQIGLLAPVAGRVLVARALDAATEEGVLWSPLLDECAVRGFWGEESETGSHGARRTDALLASVSAWAAAQDNPTTIESVLARYRSPMFWSAVVGVAPCLSDRVLAAAVRHWSVMNALASNRALTSTLVDRICTWAAASHCARTDRVPVATTAECAPHGVAPLHANDAASFLLAVAVDRGGASAGAVAILREALLTPEAVVARGDAGDCTAQGLASESFALCLGFGVPLAEADLLCVMERLGHEPWILPRIIEQPGATPAIWCRALELSTDATMRVAVATRPGAPADADVRALLLKSTSEEVRAACFPHATQREALRLLESAVKQGAPQARKYFQYLCALPSETLASWGPTVLRPLLECRHESVRQDAMLLLGFFPEPPIEAAEPVPQGAMPAPRRGRRP